MAEPLSSAGTDSRRRLNGISEIRGFFRTNTVPVYFLGPTAFNLLGVDRWVRNSTTSSTTTPGTAPTHVYSRRRKAVRRVQQQRGHQQLPAPGSGGTSVFSPRAAGVPR